ncbi:MAG TPA: UbiD family decarboxylase [Candidatus Binatia bacterium]|nr:UbiD family decarboxylase [Candidatus Binatia bacterium]
MIELSNGVKSGAEDLRNEALADLREFLRQAEAAGEVRRIDGASAESEIGTLFDLSNKHLYPPVLLFQNIPGYDSRFRIVSNVRTAKVIIGELTLDAVKAYRKRPKGKSQPIPPQVVERGPILEVVVEGDAVDLRKYPAPKWHPNDGGRYIGTECMVIMKDPDSDWVNVGTYRVMIHDDKTLGVFIDTGKHGDFIRRKYWARGEACPVAISVGQAPILGVIAASSAGTGESEYAIAGGRIGRPIRVVLAKATSLPIPADAELVFEGYMPPPEVDSRPEGPFGEWPGYYASDTRPEPVVAVKTVYHRNDPLIIGQPPLTPVHPGQQFKISRLAALWDALEAAGVPGIKGVWRVLGGGSRFITVISIDQLHPGHAKMAGLVAAGCRDGSYLTRLIIIVDDDIDIMNPAEVMWAVATRWDPKTQTDIIDGCWTGHIDPTLSPEKRASGDITTSRMIIYAVRPYHWKDQFPKVNSIDKDDAENVRRKWQGKLDFL